MTTPDVSIIVANWNYGDFLPRCMRSCLGQRNINVETIVVDDASEDDSVLQLTPFMRDVVLIKNERNIGVAASSNVGLRASKSQFVVRVDSDDFVNSDMCFFLKTYLEHNHDAFGVACDYFVVDEHENVVDRRDAMIDPISCGIMYRRDRLLSFGGYDDNMRHREEEEMRKRLGCQYTIHHMKIPFYRYRRHKRNKTLSREYAETKV